jgi:hypothetical protein
MNRKGEDLMGIGNERLSFIVNQEKQNPLAVLLGEDFLYGRSLFARAQHSANTAPISLNLHKGRLLAKQHALEN